VTKELRGFLVRLGIAFAGGLVASPVVALAFDETPFHEVMTRTFMVSLVLSFLWGNLHPRAWIANLREMGMRGPDRLLRILFGIHISVLVLLLILLASMMLGARPWLDGPFRKEFWPHLGSAVLAGVLVPLIEEPLFRGYFKDIMGGVASAFVYAVVHFFKPLEETAPAGPGFDPLLGFKRFPEMLEGWTDVHAVTLGIVSLFLFGMALNRMRERTGSLYVCIGIHGGFVFGLNFYRRFIEERADGSIWIFGGGRLHDGVIGVIALAVLLWAAYKAPIPERLTRRP
jgi:membrane protease YdiL (CAAX protease family)